MPPPHLRINVWWMQCYVYMAARNMASNKIKAQLRNTLEEFSQANCALINSGNIAKGNELYGNKWLKGDQIGKGGGQNQLTGSV